MRDKPTSSRGVSGSKSAIGGLDPFFIMIRMSA
jgi:hypothetical protein